MLKTPTKVKLTLHDVLGEPTYKIASLTGKLWVSTSKGQFRAGQTLTEPLALELTESRAYQVTVTAAR